jgi:two-component system response regulator FlrC
LRERKQDIVPLARHILARLAKDAGRHGLTLSPEAELQLTHYAWPGNIRELENVLQRALILAPGSTIEPAHLYLPAAKIAAREQPLAATMTAAAPAQQPTDIKSLERQHIMDALAATGGSRKLAAERLGMSERTLRYKLARYREEDAAGQSGA